MNISNFSRNLKISLSLFLIILVIFGSTAAFKPGVISLDYVLTILRQSVPLGLTAIGQSAVILTGGIDLAVGEIITMTNILATDLMQGSNANLVQFTALLLTLGALIGAINGFIIAKTNIPPVVMTFGMASIIRGGYLVYSGGAPQGTAPPILRFIGSGRIGIVPVSVIVYAGIAAAVLYGVYRTKWGNSIYYLGNNPTAATYAGIPRSVRLVMTYSFSSLMSVFAGLVLTGYIGVGNFTVGGDAYMLDSIAASVIGGNTFHGLGNVVGTIMGSFVLTEVQSVMTSFGVAETGKLIMRGLIIITMVTIYMRQIKGKKLIPFWNRE